MTKDERPWTGESKAAVGETSEHVDPTAPAPAVKVQPEAALDGLPEGVDPLAAAPQQRAGIPPGSKAAHDSQAAPSEAPLTFRKQESNRMCGVSSRLLERLLAIGKFVGTKEMQPETLISGLYIAMSAAYAMEAARPAEIFVATMYLGVAMIYLIVSYQRKGDRPAR